ncbi:SH3 domain-containing protein [Streptomyces sp. NPDC058045]|uniref:SH3 domain-containing protein n=1 Tax=Streptomyces sp. NPDC058045 TaxID=3346311 RepID=UPI0036E44E77
MSDSSSNTEETAAATESAESGEGTAAAAARYTVVATVNVRSGPGTSYGKVGTVPVGAQVSISCQTPGQTVTGPLGTSSIWDRIGSGRYVSDTYVRTGSDGYIAPRC